MTDTFIKKIFNIQTFKIISSIYILTFLVLNCEDGNDTVCIVLLLFIFAFNFVSSLH